MQELRKKIDEIDDKILPLFVERMEISKKVALEKKKIKKNITDNKREEEIVERLSKKYPDQKSNIKNLYQTIFNLSKSAQRMEIEDTSFEKYLLEKCLNEDGKLPTKAKIAVQGTEASYGDITAHQIFQKGEITYFDSFEKIFKAVDEEECEYGVLPIENSNYGSVNEVYDLMAKNNFYIACDYKLEINHCLLAKKGTKFEDIKEVISHEQALGQCSEFFRKNPHIKKTSFINTALAAKYVKESQRNDLAALASKSSAELLDLDILEEKVQDNQFNFTRFIVISKQMKIYKNANKISIILEIDHKPGALYELIGKFASLDLNLTKIESRPISGRDFEFIFYFDFEGSVFDVEVRKLLAELENSKRYFSFLGNYLEY